MSLTRLQYQQRIATNLNDAVGIYFDPQHIQDAIQDCYDEVVLETQCIENTVTVPFQNNLIYYDLYNTVVPSNFYYWRPCRIFNNQTNRWVGCVDSRVLDKFRYDWELASGTPWFAYIVNYQYLGFFPHYPAGAVGGFDILYKVGKDVLSSDAQVLQIPDEFNRIVESGVTGELLEGYQEFSKASDYLQDYEELKARLKVYVATRSLPDKLWQLNDLDSLAIHP